MGQSTLWVMAMSAKSNEEQQSVAGGDLLHQIAQQVVVLAHY